MSISGLIEHFNHLDSWKSSAYRTPKRSISTEKPESRY